MLANKVKLSGKEALATAKVARHIYVCRGKKLIHFDLEKDPPSDDELLKHILGPTGNLRAPTIRVDESLLVGFNREAYEKVFG